MPIVRFADGPRWVPDELMQATHAAVQDLFDLARGLVEAGGCSFRQVSQSMPLLGEAVEMAAVLTLKEWEQSGLCSRMTGRLPTAAEAGRQQSLRLNRRHFRNAPFESGSLAVQVARARLAGLAWGGNPILGAELALAGLNGDGDDAGIEALAKLLWQHRGSSRSALTNEKGHS